MKSTGIVRKVDELGRVVLPIELRRTLGINEKDPLEVYTDEDKVVLKKYVSSEEVAERKSKVEKGQKYCDNLKLKASLRQKQEIEYVQKLLEDLLNEK